MSSTNFSRPRALAERRVECPVEAQADRRELPDAPVFPSLGRPISRIGFGTGGLSRTASPRRRQDLLAAALANGITHFDTAPIYGFGESERALGRFLPGRRGQVTLTTKFGLKPSRLAARLSVFQQAGRRVLRMFPSLRGAAVRSSRALYAPPSFSVSDVRASLESSLRSLRTDYVDFFLAHQASVETLPGEEIIGLLEDLRRAGKILAFGVATEFDWLLPVLESRPQLGRVIQFDSELTRANAAAFSPKADQLLITYSFIGRAVALCRERLQTDSTLRTLTESLNRSDDGILGAMLVRGAVLANPRGIVLMQSRSIERIERMHRAFMNDAHAITKAFGNVEDLCGV